VNFWLATVKRRHIYLAPVDTTTKLYLCDAHFAIRSLNFKYRQITQALATGQSKNQSKCTLDRLEFRNYLYADLRIPGPVPSP
jgi:hypothetical protein